MRFGAFRKQFLTLVAFLFALPACLLGQEGGVPSHGVILSGAKNLALEDDRYSEILRYAPASGGTGQNDSLPAVPNRGGLAYEKTFSLAPTDSIFQLDHQFLIPNSDTVWIDTLVLQKGRQYLLNERYGVVTLRTQNLPFSLQDTTQKRRLTVRYQALPLKFRTEYQHRRPVLQLDTATGKERSVAIPTKPFTLDDVFGADFQRSGSILRGLSLGSNRDLSLSSGFRLQMSGKLSDDLDITAALTDENTPIQPEGTTQRLQEVDKVFVEVRGRNLAATMGDFNINVEGSEFARFSRKLQGVMGTVNYRSGSMRGDVLVSGATTRGKFTTNQFQGIEGVQGPYRLTGQNQERDLIVVAGTERVYLNGEQMTRGEINDYIIDYANAEVTFTPRRLITRASRITIDFEYADRQYSRSLIGGKSSTSIFDGKGTFEATFLRENDDEDAPIDLVLSDSDRTLLQNAGNDRLAASRTGVEFVGPGMGQYSARDTAIISAPGDTTRLTIYVYAPQDSLNAVYSVKFASVGSGNGDYERYAAGRFRFVGIRQGSYAPVRLLPLPQSHTVTDFRAKVTPVGDLSVTAEYALSNFDRNSFSALQDRENAGGAFNAEIQYAPKDVKIGGANFGSLDLRLRERLVNRNFASIDRINAIEFNRAWDITDPSQLTEEIREGSLAYQPDSALQLTGALGRLERGESFVSQRYTAGSRFVKPHLPTAEYAFELIDSKDTRLATDGSWIRQRGRAEYERGIFLPSVRFETEKREQRAVTLDTLQRGSFRFSEVAPALGVNVAGRVSLSSELIWRRDDSLAAGILAPSSRSFTQRYGVGLREWRSFSTSIDVALRTQTLLGQFAGAGEGRIKTFLLRSQTRYNPFARGIESEIFYEVASERSAKNERVFQRVPRGAGNYIYLGDVNNNNEVDEADFQQARFDGDFVVFLVPSDQFVPVTNLSASGRLRVNGSRLVSGAGWLAGGLSALSSETYLRLAEKNTDPDTKRIYLLQLSRFLNPLYTLDGSNQLTQDFFILENNPLASLRLRFQQREGLTQFSLQNERAYSRERSVRLRWRLVEEISNQIDFTNRAENLSATQFSSRVRGIRSNTLSTDFSYRPEQDIEIGFRFGTGRATNFDTTSADLNDQAVRVVYSIRSQGQARAEFTREEVILTRATTIQPYELTSGRVEGKTWLWRFDLEYRLTQFIQANVTYDGRVEGDRAPLHSARAELRAFF